MKLHQEQVYAVVSSGIITDQSSQVRAELGLVLFIILAKGVKMAETELTQEERIMRMMKRVLTNVAKDTHAKPGFRHPLSDETIDGIRECLSLIAAREQELAQENGREMNMRPRFIDEPRSEVVVPIDLAGLRSKPTDS